MQQQSVALQTARLTINAYINISKPFWQPQAHREQRKRKTDVSLRISDIFVYVHNIYASPFLLSAYGCCRPTAILSNQAGGGPLQGQLPTSPQRS